MCLHIVWWTYISFFCIRLACLLDSVFCCPPSSAASAWGGASSEATEAGDGASAAVGACNERVGGSGW